MDSGAVRIICGILGVVFIVLIIMRRRKRAQP